MPKTFPRGHLTLSSWFGRVHINYLKSTLKEEPFPISEYVGITTENCHKKTRTSLFLRWGVEDDIFSGNWFTTKY